MGGNIINQVGTHSEYKQFVDDKYIYGYNNGCKLI
jgi:hypothetical protein